MVPTSWKTDMIAMFLLLTVIGRVNAAAKFVSSTDEIEIKTFHVQSLVVSRYAFTTIKCRIFNPSELAKEALFSVLLPSNAFISNLTIEAGGYNYSSAVEEKEKARRTYEKAKHSGNNAAIVHQKERDTSRFRVDVNIAAKDEVVFYLNYEEFLMRNLGKYTLTVNIHPNYIVKDVTIDVTIHETRDISEFKTIKVPGGEKFLGALSEWVEGNKTARVQFDPDPKQLPQDYPITGQLVVEYDVKRSLDTGDVQIEDGYFVHFFAPVDLQHTPKYITFLIDTSGSMTGMKLAQVKDALRRILKDLNKGDYFSIITFSHSANKLIDARFTSASVKKALKLVDNLEAGGSTNIDLAFKEILTGELKETEGVISHIIILLTDGRATTGVQNTERILKNTRDRNRQGATIFCLAFGKDADYYLLEKLALQNGGLTKKIYIDHDVADQLQYFYQSLSTPLLIEVKFRYSNGDINENSLTNADFHNYFQGTELVIAGQMQKNHIGGIRANITGKGRNGEVTMGVTEFNTVSPPNWVLIDNLHLSPTPRKFIRRIWAFLMVKELLNKEKAAIDKSQRILARHRALQLALQYHFVTPLTSLVVVQPDSQECQDYDDGDEEEEIPDNSQDIDDSSSGDQMPAMTDDLNADSKTTVGLVPKIHSGDRGSDYENIISHSADIRTGPQFSFTSSSAIVLAEFSVYIFTFLLILQSSYVLLLKVSFHRIDSNT